MASFSGGLLVKKRILSLFAFLFLLAIGILGYVEAILLGKASPSTGFRAVAWVVVALVGLVGATAKIVTIVRAMIAPARTHDSISKQPN